MRIVNQEDDIGKGEVEKEFNVKIEETPKQVVAPTTFSSSLQPSLPKITPPSKFNFSEPEKKRTWGTKGWWILKTPILIYMILSYGYAYLGGMAVSTYLKNPIITWITIILHTLILAAFIMVCALTTRRGDKK